MPNGPTLSSEETARRGDEIYERDIRKLVEAAHHGEVVAIEVDERRVGHRRERDRRDGPPAVATAGRH